MIKMMIQAAIFDFEGVVLDFPLTGIEKLVSNRRKIEGKVLENTFWKDYAYLVQCVLPSDWEEQLRAFLLRITISM